MLARPSRLTRRPDYVACYNTGRRYFSKHFIVFALEREGAAPVWRYGLAVSRKVGNAVRRNRTKRVLREFFRLYQDDMPGGMDLVVVPKRRLDPRRVTLDLAVQELLPLMREIRDSLCREANDGTP
ncbi:ribonuclease P protein component [Oleidesulfovibrio alaskensis]|uniref:ribonuclease P protein component n=1 Tax=Oleidesulfovibrio alaskensis TaxID=58180 RepID=UPI00048411D6|nr:ribonuclease P protein component [Oleidesulfovibrio alaskensis]MBL3581713.1 ribonuclease P protein component [Oleidesulfovibrio alaskensis]